MAPSMNDETSKEPRFIPLSYNNADSQASALRLALTVNPSWANRDGEIEYKRFTDGITNTILKITMRKPGWTEEQIDNEAVLMRAYGNNTEILIDRDREAKSHSLLAERGLATPLLARFRNGLLYKFIQGQVCTPHDLIQEQVWRAVARRLGEWHARLPTIDSPHEIASQTAEDVGGMDSEPPSLSKALSLEASNFVTSRKPERNPGPSLWTVLQKWILALPTATPAEKSRQSTLQKELERTFDDLDSTEGLGDSGLVFAHCDLLSANVIMLPCNGKPLRAADECTAVSFIDYEYATPCPAAFDIANHFAEWGGYDCDYNMLPTKSVRKEFLQEYLRSYNQHLKLPEDGNESEFKKLYDGVDRFRGMPGFYWGIWALIQATISQIDFDYASYAEVRLGEYWAWREEVDGTREKEGKELPLRERRWAQEA